MKALILGASGHIGKRLISYIKTQGDIEVISASRGRSNIDESVPHIPLDTRNLQALVSALREVDAVVNCVAGDAGSIAQGAKTLVDAAIAAHHPRIVHLSSMAVYGGFEGLATENTAFDPALGWYAKAKCEAEAEINRYAEQGGNAIVLRPGCVSGPGSELWVGRIGRWLQTGRLGDLGVQGDGWSNLIHVDDVCAAIAASLKKELQTGQVLRFNLAATDSPRWNQYFVDLALAIHATPVARISRRQLLLDANLAGPPLKILEKLTGKLGIRANFLPDALPPALVRFFSQSILLDSSLATNELQLKHISYSTMIKDNADWFLKNGF